MKLRKSSIVSIKDVINGILNDPRSPLSKEKKDIFDAWERTVGEEISSRCSLEWFRKGVLGISVSDPIWFQEMRFRAEQIKRAMNETLGKEIIRKMEFYLRFS